jgi:hypothetical protein
MMESKGKDIREMFSNIHIPSRAELKQRKVEYEPTEKMMKKLFTFIIPTAYTAYIYPERNAICKDIKTINEKLSEAGI